MTGLTFDCGDDGIAILTIDIPGKTMNLATPELGLALAEAVARVAGDPSIKGAVVTSAKADFMAGGDIHALVNGFGTLGDAAAVYRNIARPFSEMLRRLETCGKPFVAAINGSALGGGLELALACHHRIVADAEKLIIAMPEVTIGLIPGAGGTQRLPRMIGIRQAVHLMLDGTRLTPAEALKRGVVDAVVAPGELMQAARAWVASCTQATQPWDRKGYVVPGGAGFFDPAITAFFNVEATAITVKTHHTLPAPIALLDAVAHGTAVPIEAGLRIEARAFTKLLMEPTARNLMRTEFLSKSACDKLAARPAGIARRPPARIGVIGAGLMGAGLAQVSADAGLDVVLIDVSAELAAASLERIGRAYAKKVERGTLTRARADAALARMTPTEEYAALAPCDLVVEAVFEDQAVKQAVLARAAAVLRPDAVLASNTSGLPITGLGAALPQPDRFIGLHFFSPVDRMALVEVVRGRRTSDETLAHALDFIKALRKTPIIVKDAPGFFTTRVITAYLFECIGMVGEGVAPTLVDNAARQAGFAIGPLALMDELTLDLTHHAESKRRDLAGAGWQPPHGFDVLDRFVTDLGRTGRRNGAGFYDYPDGKRRPWAGLSEIYAPAGTPQDVSTLKRRMLFIQSLEAARAFEEGVIGNPGEGDVGAVLGIGFPAYTGGVFSLIDTMGIARFAEEADQLADRFGERYRPTAWLKHRAARGEGFYAAGAA
jgi:3-hydroxyacyl-CoA dehydrogenase/enoyl-CoA hydratase/3-hydroxybutyryl-CoA epimerase